MSRRLSARNVSLTLGIGVILGFAIVSGYRPELMPPSLSSELDRLTSMFGIRATILGAGGLLACLGGVASWVWRTTHDATVLSAVTAETPDRDVAVTGTALTTAFKHQRDHPSTGDRTVETQLRNALVELYSREFADPERARAYIDDGEWTEDQVAAATLTTTDAVDFPLVYRLYAWLYPGHAYAYRIERTLRIVEETCVTELTGYSPPRRSYRRISRLRALFDSGGERR